MIDGLLPSGGELLSGVIGEKSLEQLHKTIKLTQVVVDKTSNFCLFISIHLLVYRAVFPLCMA